MAVTATTSSVPRTSTAASTAGAVAVTAALALLVAGLAVLDITQGTASVGAAEVGKALTGHADPGDASVVIASRLPRMAAGILVGVCLGMAGAALQAVSRNVLAAPDTLAVNAGSYLALGLLAATGISVPFLASSGIAFVGGLAAAAVVLGLSGPAPAPDPSGSSSPEAPSRWAQAPSPRRCSCCSPSGPRASTSGTRAASARTGSTA